MLADLKARMDAMFAKAGVRPPSMGPAQAPAPEADPTMQVEAPAPEADPAMQIRAPSPGPDRMDVNSDGDVPDFGGGPQGLLSGAGATKRAPQFRDQANAHDAEVAQIQSVIDGLEQAQANDRRNNSSARMGELGLRAGQAVSNGIAHLPLTETGPLTPKISEGDQKLQSAKLKESMKQDLFKRENPEAERMNKLQMEQYKEILRRNEDAAKAAQHEKDKKQQADQFGQSQQTQKDIAQARDQALLDAAGISSGNQVASRVGERAANEEYSQAERDNKHTFDGIAIRRKNDEVVDGSESNKMDGVIDSYNRVGPALDRVIALIDNDPRGVAKWGSGARSELRSAIMSAAEATVKNNGDGVMNGRDKDNAMQQIGSPEEFEQMITANGGAGLKEMRSMIKSQLLGRIGSKYEVGEGQSSKLTDVQRRAAGSAAKVAGMVRGGQSIVAPMAPKIPGARTGGRSNPEGPAVPGTQPYTPPTTQGAAPAAEPAEPKRGRSIVWTPGSKAKVVVE